MASHPQPPPLTTPPLPPAATGESDESPDAPNLLGGAYDSSGDEEENAPTPCTAAASTATATANAKSAAVSSASTGGSGATQRKSSGSSGEGAGVGHVVEPDEAKRGVVEKMVAFVARNGQAFEDRVRERWACFAGIETLLVPFPCVRFFVHPPVRCKQSLGLYHYSCLFCVVC